MTNPTLSFNKAFKQKATKFTKTTFCAIPQTYISKILSKHITEVLALLILYKTAKNPKRVFKLLSCVIFTIIRNYVCIDYLASEAEKKRKLPVGFGGGYKQE